MLILGALQDFKSALACPLIGVKWLKFLFSDLGTDLRHTGLSCFLAVAALLKPANVPQTTKRQGYEFHMWILDGDGDLLRGIGWSMIHKLGPSETTCG